MGTSEYKLNITALMEQIEDSNILANVYHYLERFAQKPESKKLVLTDEQNEAITKSIDSIEKNGTLSTEDVMAEMKEKYPQLYK